MSTEERELDLHRKVTELHTTVCGRGGLVDRIEKVEAAHDKQSKIVAWLGGGIGAVSGWAAFKEKLIHLFQ